MDALTANAKRNAIDARMRALACGDPREKADWLDAASAWDTLAKEYAMVDAVLSAAPQPNVRAVSTQ